MRKIVLRADGYRLCSFCRKEWIGQCFGFVVAGDLVLALEGRLPADEVRERCGRCAMRFAADREGACGVRRQLLAVLYDIGRWVSWKLQYRFRRPLERPLERHGARSR